jgi:predicted SPOUT superfamily RNA methylase MTH1
MIARALAVFCVDEIIIFDDDPKAFKTRVDDLHTEQYTAFTDPSHFLTHVLAYLETPPYLRKHLFPMHPNLKLAGVLPSLDMPHHLRANEWCEYREGVVVPDGDNDGGGGPEGGGGRAASKMNGIAKPAIIETGLPQNVIIHDMEIPELARVTVKFPSRDAPEDAEPVDPNAHREESGYYWGYSVRRANSLSAVFTESPFDEGYDLSFGTSERGASIANVLVEPSLPKYEHLLVVFGGVAGIEEAVRADKKLLNKGIMPTDAEKLFDYWINILPGQGSRTIRTEEAIWLGLMGLRPLVVNNRNR